MYRRTTITCLLLTLACAAAAAQAPGEKQPAPKLILLNADRLAAAREHLARKDSPLRPALDRLLRAADAALKDGPFSVTDRKTPAPSGDKHDYMSLAPYWWPDPDKKDGLPYVRHDGKTNPAARTDAYDSGRMGKMGSAVETLALAYHFTGEDRYARRAALLRRTWFLGPKTKMNPHLKYAQAIPGVNDGRGIGIIDTVRLLNVPDSVALLAPSAAWTAKDTAGMRRWFADYLDWLLTSPHGKDEDRATNNHGSWYDAQAATFALFAGRDDVARKVAEAAKKRRIAAQIEPDGKQPRELARTRSFGYSAFNVRALFALATAAERVGVDLWRFETKDGRGLRKALAYLLPYADPKAEWPHKEIRGVQRGDLLPLLLQADAVYGEPAYLNAARQHLADELSASRSRLLWAGKGGR
jgi:hypothetical protein